MSYEKNLLYYIYSSGETFLGEQNSKTKYRKNGKSIFLRLNNAEKKSFERIKSPNTC